MAKFRVDEPVRFVNLTYYENLTGTVLGVSASFGAVDMIIVLLDTPLAGGTKAVVVPHGHLRSMRKYPYADNGQNLSAYCDWLEYLNDRYTKALKECIARAGIPDAQEACRAIIKTAEDALNPNRQNSSSE